MNFWKMMGTVSVIAVAVSVAAAQDAQTPTDLCAAAATDEPATREYTQAEDVLEAGVDYRAIFCTKAGAIYVDLFEKIAPVTVNNFVFLAEEGYYNNTTFHRVLQDFMVQGGDPTGTGSGGPGYQFEDETPGFVTFNREGLLAMANAGAGTNGSQFFITTSIPDYLNYKHTIFGDVLEGYDTLTSITLRDPNASPAPTTDGDALNTVIIVTDATTVATTFTEEVTAATQEELIAALTTAVAPETLPTDLTTEGVLVQTLDDVVATVPDTVQGAYRDALEANNFEYRLAVEVSQTACNDQYGFDLLGYRVDAFASATDASAFLTTDVLTAINTERGYEPVPAPVGSVAFKTAAPLCNEAAGSVEQISVQRGRYVATIYGQFSDDIIANTPVSILLVNSIGAIFESTLVDAYGAELR